jgi:molybdate transport system substrate-binding protein
MTRAGSILAGAALALMLAACGGSGAATATAGGASTGGGTLDVYAATSLSGAFTALAHAYEAEHQGWDVRLELAGSDVLATQIDQGAHADVYAAASPKYPDELHAKGLVDPPQPFASNSLVLIVPADDPAGIHAVGDLRGGAKLVIGDAAVPVGSYTRDVLDRLSIPLDSLHVVSEQTNVGEIVTKVALGEADAGFVYVTDAKAAGEEVRAITLPAAAQPTVTYPIALVSDTGDRGAARAWVGLVQSARGQEVLRRFGFEPAPQG